MNLTIIKIGGNILDNPVAYQKALDDFAALQGPKILVHGGGKIATQLSEQLHYKTQMVAGRRVTDAQTLDVVVMVYAGLINKKIVAALQARGNNALGLTGADLNLIRSSKRAKEEIDYGFVGNIEKINVSMLVNLLKNGIFPVFSPITHDGNGQLLNTNADSIAAQLAIALHPFFEVSLKLCFEQNGVLQDINDPNSVISSLNPREYRQLYHNHVIHSGMLPKLENAFYALEQGVQHVFICHANHILTHNKQKYTELIL
jgi:acetylglutamate kinase